MGPQALVDSLEMRRGRDHDRRLPPVLQGSHDEAREPVQENVVVTIDLDEMLAGMHLAPEDVQVVVLSVHAPRF